jgi:hypothetical protein
MLRCRGGRSGLTVAGDDLQLQWWRGGLWHEQPGGVLARVLEGDECGGGGGFIDAIAWARGRGTDPKTGEIRRRSSRCSTC